MKRTWTIIGVSDVPASFRWYQSLFGQPEAAPAHGDFGQLLDSDGTVLLCLHEWGAHEHPSLMSPDHGTPGNGLLLFFRVDDFDLALQRARALVPRLEEEPHANPNTRTNEFSLRDPDGYYVTISALESSLGTKRGETAMKKSGSQKDKAPSQLIDARIKELGDWRGKLLGRLRSLIKEAVPEVVEEWKWSVPVWSHDGLICTGETYKNVVKMTFAKGAALKDPSGLFNSSLEGNTRRAIDFREGEKIDEKAFKALVRAAVTLNKSKAN